MTHFFIKKFNKFIITKSNLGHLIGKWKTLLQL
jgi:hypothetical protein